MALPMSRPFKHPKTGVYYYRRVLPDDLRALLGKREEKRSLRTKDPAVARTRHAEMAAQVEKEWRAHRFKTEPLSQRQIVALGGLVYREILSLRGDEPGMPATWEDALQLVHNARAKGKLEQWFGPTVDEVLLREGLRVDGESRARLIEESTRAYEQAAAVLKRYAEGDYRPDAAAARFPDWQPSTVPNSSSPVPKASVQPAGKVTLTGLIDAWWIEAKATGRKPSTHESYRNTMARLVKLLKHDDAGRVTPEDVIAFKDHRLAEVNPRNGKPISPKTVKGSDLNALKVVFDWAVENRKLPSNPAAGVTLKLGKAKRVRGKGFTDEEALAVLSHALNHQPGQERPKTAAAKRWVPWLCAYTGARVGEIAQLRKQDVRKAGGRWSITITPEAGTVKTNEAREVPLHTHLMELGFPAFVQDSADGPLFLTPSRTGDVLGPLQGVKNRLAEFVREVIIDPNVAPNHAWRHRFKSVARDVGMDAGVRDAIQGHDAKSIAEQYGEVSMRAKTNAIGMLPAYHLKS